MNFRSGCIAVNKKIHLKMKHENPCKVSKHKRIEVELNDIIITSKSIYRNLYFLKHWGFFLVSPCVVLHCRTHMAHCSDYVLSLWYHSLTDKQVRGGVWVMIVERNVPEEDLQRAVNCGNPLSHCHQLLAGPLIIQLPTYRCISCCHAQVMSLP